jgi:hypothetical protein
MIVWVPTVLPDPASPTDADRLPGGHLERHAANGLDHPVGRVEGDPQVLDLK